MLRQLSGHDLLALHTAATRDPQSDPASRPLLLDVREPWEFALAAIRLDGLRTLNIPMHEMAQRLAELAPPHAAAGHSTAHQSTHLATQPAAQSTAQSTTQPTTQQAMQPTMPPATQPIVCICHHGVRSAQVVAFLERQGFGAVYNLAGGIDAWSQQIDADVPRY